MKQRQTKTYLRLKSLNQIHEKIANGNKALERMRINKGGPSRTSHDEDQLGKARS